MLQEFYQVLSEIYRLNCVRALLEWDQQVCMPAAGGAERAEQQELLSRLVHDKFTNEKFIKVVDELFSKVDLLNEADRVNVREIKRLLDRERKLPREFVAEKARVASLSYVEWTKARPQGDFARVKGYLQKIVELNRQEADLVGYKENPYDALLDYFEPQATLAQVKRLLMQLAETLTELIPGLCERFSGGGDMGAEIPIERQQSLCTRIAGDIGYSFERGRLDKALHPFQTSLGPNDIRITTRFDPQNYLSAIFSMLHEGGHALYEMGLPTKDYKGTPMGSPVSLAIHESQSRLWENMIGRSLSFAIYLHRVLKEFSPDGFADSSPESIWSRANRIAPSLIRIEADEVTYSLHVVVRMLLEEQLINGGLGVADLPAAWNELYQKYLGVKPSSDREGVLQDVHWYSGMIGYFPTYVLGNLYSALFMEAARSQISDLEGQVAQGRFEALTAWLKENIHQHGMRFGALELARRVSGQELSIEPFVRYIRRKFAV